MSSLKRTSTKSFQIELVTKYDTNGAKRELLVGGVQICEGGSISARGFGPGGAGMLKSCRNVESVPECLSRAGKLN